MRNGPFDSSKTSALYCSLDPLRDRGRLSPTLIRKQGSLRNRDRMRIWKTRVLPRTSLRATGDI